MPRKSIRIADLRAQKTASYLHRTATTVYPCCVPTLGDSTGAGRVGLADRKYTTFCFFRNKFDGRYLAEFFIFAS